MNIRPSNYRSGSASATFQLKKMRQLVNSEGYYYFLAFRGPLSQNRLN